ncbi:hypothetical protein Peur_030913 [Populus x canadensis]
MDSGPSQLAFFICSGLPGFSFFLLSDMKFQLGPLSPFECGKYRNYLTTKWERHDGHITHIFASGTQLHPASRKLPAGMVQLIPCSLFLVHVDSFTVWFTFS